MISIIFWILAAICKAIADNLAHHFYKSVFNSERLSKRFWDEEESNKNPVWIPFTKYKWSAWHVFNSLMIIFFGCSILTPHIVYSVWWEVVIMLIPYGIIWILTFNLFYNKILNKN